MSAKKLTKRIIASVVSAMLVLSCFVLPSVFVRAAEETTVNIHYFREDGNYGAWDVWAWAEGLDGAAYAFTDNGDSNGAVASVTLTQSTSSLGFIVRKPDWSAKDPDGDRKVDLSSVVSGTVEVYCVAGSELEDFTVNYDNAVQGLKVKTAAASTKTEVKVEYTMAADLIITAEDFTITSASGAEVAIASYESDTATTAVLTLAEELDYSKDYTLAFGGSQLKITLPDYFSSAEFEEEFTYDGDDLGAIVENGGTNFRVWAPTAEKVELNIYAAGNGGDAESVVTMEKAEKGTWVAAADGDLSGKYYTYTAYFDGKVNKDIVDPYARTTGVNGKRGMIISLDTTDPEGWENDERKTYENVTDMEIYELHVRDFSIADNSGIQNKGKYLAFTETGTTTPEGTATGIDHLKDLGVTSVHLLPVYDYGSVDESKLDKAQFNWGYDPVNYNTPEGSYSTDPFNGEVRVKEFKQMVQALHDAGIGVIMDVVYNHTYNTQYCFNQLVPGYFYRPNQNTSGCGNDVASERSMVSKFIVDSVKYWAEEYHLDGFRFDLMGILDVDTMNAVRAAVDEVDPSIIIYGEGWNMGCVPTKAGVKMANYTNAALTPGIAYFSDTIRDMIKGSVFDAAEKGFVNGESKHYKAIVNTVQYTKKWCPSPSQVINYADCHDNLTLWDKIRSSNGDDSEELQIRQNKFAAAIVHTAQGVPFMMSGEEFLRTKTKADGSFDHNSYASPDSVNELDYSRVAQYQDVYDYYKGLIEFRKAHPAFRIANAAESDAAYTEAYDYTTEKGVSAYFIDGTANGENAEQIMVIYNPLYTDTTVNLPEGEWGVLVDDRYAGADPDYSVSESVSVAPLSAMVLIKGYTAPEKVFDIKEHTVGIVGSFNGWGADGEIVMTDDNGLGFYEGTIVIDSVTPDMLLEATTEELVDGEPTVVSRGFSGIQFKIRLDGEWQYSWGEFEPLYCRTQNSQTNFCAEYKEGEKAEIHVYLDTRKIEEGAQGEYSLEDDDAYNVWDTGFTAIHFTTPVEEPEYLKGHTVGITGSFNNWGTNGEPDVPMTDEDGDGIYKGKIEIAEVTDDMILEATTDAGPAGVVSRGFSGVQFKIRLDGEWADSWGEFEEAYCRTWNSQTNFCVEAVVGKPLTINVYLDTTKVAEGAEEEYSIEDEDAYNVWEGRFSYTIPGEPEPIDDVPVSEIAGTYTYTYTDVDGNDTTLFTMILKEDGTGSVSNGELTHTATWTVSGDQVTVVANDLPEVFTYTKDKLTSNSITEFVFTKAVKPEPKPDDDEQSSKPDESSQDDSSQTSKIEPKPDDKGVNTGDSTGAAFAAVLLFVSGISVMAVVISRKSRTSK